MRFDDGELQVGNYVTDILLSGADDGSICNLIYHVYLLRLAAIVVCNNAR